MNVYDTEPMDGLVEVILKWVDCLLIENKDVK